MTTNLPAGCPSPSTCTTGEPVCPKCWSAPCVCNHGPTTGAVNWFTPPVDYDKIREIVREEIKKSGYVPCVSNADYADLVEKAERYDNWVKLVHEEINEVTK